MTRAYRVMGVLNVTPDSFSDGGRFLDVDAAVEHARVLVEEGADIVDVGGESTRPGAEPVAAAEETERVAPVIERLAALSPPPADGQRDGTDDHAGGGAPQISIDTSKAVVARAALAAGASLVNDVTAFRADPEMASLVADAGADCCLMHMLGEPRTMQRDPRYRDVVDDVKAFLSERLAFAVGEGVDERRIMLDPGIGFGKTVAHNLTLLARLDELTELGRPLLVGTSRKSFIGRVLSDGDGDSEPAPMRRRLAGTIATNVLALERGASVFRVHEVRPVADALAVAAATLGRRWSATRGTMRTGWTTTTSMTTARTPPSRSPSR
jgi:dihydropteroate synthase